MSWISSVLTDALSWGPHFVHSLWTFPFVVLAMCYESSHCMDVKPQKEIYLPDYNFYHNLSAIQHRLSNLRHDSIEINQTHISRYKRPLFIVHITNSTNNKPKPRILIVSGQHAREFFPVESILTLIKNITTGLHADAKSIQRKYSKFFVNYLDLYIVPMMNPDGRRYIEKKNNYCWRGTGTGVDLERNFDWNYGGPGSSSNMDDEEYRGTGPFSEPECQVLLDLTRSVHFDAFISLHSGNKQIYIPYADTRSKHLVRRAPNMNAMLNLAAVMAKSPPEEKFAYGLASDIADYSADGTMYDYMAGIREIPFSLTVELWGAGKGRGQTCFDIYNPVSDDLKSSINDVQPVYEALFLYMIRWKKDQIRRKSYLALRPLRSQHDEPSLTLGVILLCLVIVITLVYTVKHKLPFWLHIFPRRRVVSLRTLSSTFYPYRPVNKN